MKFTLLALAGVLCLASIPLVSHAQRGFLETEGTFKPTFSLSENWTDAFVLSTDPFDPLTKIPEVVSTVTTTVTMTANMDGVDLTVLNETTPFSLTIGGFNYSGTLGDDRAYTPGKASISIPLHGYNEETNKAIGVSFLKLAWTAKVLTFTLTTSHKSNNPDLPPLMTVFMHPGLPAPKIRQILVMDASFDFVGGMNAAFLSGSATVGEKIHEETPYPLNSYKVTAAADFTGPTLTVTAPVKGSRFLAESPPIMSGKVSDAYGVTMVEVSLDPTNPLATWEAATILVPPLPEGEEWGAGTGTWTFDLLAVVGPMAQGNYVLGVRAWDTSGNASAIVSVPITIIENFNCLAVTPTFKPALTSTATWTDKVLTLGGMAGVYIEAKGTMVLTANLDGIDLASLGETTPFELTLGELSLAKMLGDDPLYAPGKTTATLTVTETGKTATVKLVWTAKALTITVTYLGAGDPGSGNFGPLDWLRPALGTSNVDVRSMSAVAVTFGLHTGTTTLHAGLKDVIVNKPYNSVSTPFETITSTAALDLAPPVVTITLPANNSTHTTATVTVKGKLTEGYNLDVIEWSRDFSQPSLPVLTTPFTKTSITPVFGPEDDWGAVSGTWEIAVPTVAGGGDQIFVRAVDKAGNVSAPVAVAWNRPLLNASLAGKWQGILQRPVEDADPNLALKFTLGRLNMTSTTKGGVTGKIGIFPLMAADVAFVGILNELPGGGAQFYSKVTLVAGEPANWLKGTITGSRIDVELTDLAAIPLVYMEGTLIATPYTATNNVPAGLRGIHNAAITVPPENGVGLGYFSTSVDKAGAVTIAGKLADGTLWTWSGPLGTGGIIPVCTPLYLNKGGVAGAMTLTDTTGTSLACDRFTWFKAINFSDPIFPLGLDTEGTVAGAKYTPINMKTFTTLALDATSDDSACALDVDLAINPATGAVVLPDPNDLKVKVTVTTTSGLVTGSYLTEDGKTSNFWTLLIGNATTGFNGQGLIIADPAIGNTIKRFGAMTVAPAN